MLFNNIQFEDEWTWAKWKNFIHHYQFWFFPPCFEDANDNLHELSLSQTCYTSRTILNNSSSYVLEYQHSIHFWNSKKKNPMKWKKLDLEIKKNLSSPYIFKNINFSKEQKLLLFSGRKWVYGIHLQKSYISKNNIVIEKEEIYHFEILSISSYLWLRKCDYTLKDLKIEAFLIFLLTTL